MTKARAKPMSTFNSRHELIVYGGFNEQGVFENTAEVFEFTWDQPSVCKATRILTLNPEFGIQLSD